MITNERQYKITKGQLAKFKKGVEVFNLEETARQVGSIVLAKAELNGFKSEIKILENQIREYETLKSGEITKFQANTLDELPIILIRARIAQKLSQRELGKLVGIKEQQIQRYESEKYASASLRRLIEIAGALKLDINEIAEISLTSNTSAISTMPTSLDWSKFPVREMYKRGWFERFQGSISDLDNVGNELAEEFVKSYFKKPTLALHRKLVRLGSQYDRYALLAWECRILDLASKVEITKVVQLELLNDEWFKEVRKISILPDGPRRAQNTLKEAGIILIIEPHLPGTHLDGAAMLLNGEIPVIGMTLRYDRIDNFWFVLFHELIHVTKHLKKGKLENIFDDLDANDEEEIEKEADILASNTLIPSDDWDKALLRFTHSKEAIKNFASKLEINQAIVAGRIRNETNNFTILNVLVGQGEVRKHFPEVKFGI
ncbi:MAG: XRE family transcriptional regulator [Anaerolineae bacterium]|nr:XRE family transcriptional regulator [Anaerolineae bacterium]